MRVAAYVCFALALAFAGVWVAHGQHLATLTQKLVQKEVVDEEFGDTEIVQVWEETFEIGLDIAGPGVGGFLFLGFGLLVVNRRRQAAEPGEPGSSDE